MQEACSHGGTDRFSGKRDRASEGAGTERSLSSCTALEADIEGLGGRVFRQWSTVPYDNFNKSRSKVAVERHLREGVALEDGTRSYQKKGHDSGGKSLNTRFECSPHEFRHSGWRG